MSLWRKKEKKREKELCHERRRRIIIEKKIQFDSRIDTIKKKRVILRQYRSFRQLSQKK